MQVATALLEQAEAEKSGTKALGTTKAAEELARREKELADELGGLVLLEAGTRAEELDAEKARHARLQEELKYLKGRFDKLVIRSESQGVVTTPRLKENVGQYLEEGAAICEIERADSLEIDITLPEQEVTDVAPGQRVELKALALPFATFETEVDRIAPSAQVGELHSTVVVYSRLQEVDSELRPGMTGYARIECGKQPIGRIAIDKVLRYVRTEFWW